MKVRLTGSNGVSPTFKAKQTTTIPANAGRTTTPEVVEIKSDSIILNN
jgi:hypothetical protein